MTKYETAIISSINAKMDKLLENQAFILSMVNVLTYGRFDKKVKEQINDMIALLEVLAYNEEESKSTHQENWINLESINEIFGKFQ